MERYEYYFIEGQNGTVHHVDYPNEENAENGFSFLWCADMGIENSDKVRTLITDLLPQADFVIHGGDIAYANMRDRLGDNSDTYNAVYDQ